MVGGGGCLQLNNCPAYSLRKQLSFDGQRREGGREGGRRVNLHSKIDRTGNTIVRAKLSLNLIKLFKTLKLLYIAKVNTISS